LAHEMMSGHIGKFAFTSVESRCNFSLIDSLNVCQLQQVSIEGWGKET